MSEMSPLVLIGVRVPHVSGLFAGGPGGGEAKGLLDVLADGHGAQDVQEDEAAVGHVVTQKVPVTESLNPVDGREGKLCHNSPIKNGVEHGEEGGEGEPYGNIDFIFTIVRSRFVFFSFSSSASILRFRLRSMFPSP